MQKATDTNDATATLMRGIGRAAREAAHELALPPP
jgi:hypothetical protein